MYKYQVCYTADAIGYMALGICTVAVPNLISSVEDEYLVNATKSKLAHKFLKSNLQFEIKVLGFQLA